MTPRTYWVMYRLWSSPVVYLLRGLKSWNAYRHRSKHHGYELLTCVRLCQVVDQACWHTISDIVLRACLCVFMCWWFWLIIFNWRSIYICRLQFIQSISAKCHWARHRTFALPLGAWNLALQPQTIWTPSGEPFVLIFSHVWSFSAFFASRFCSLSPNFLQKTESYRLGNSPSEVPLASSSASGPYDEGARLDETLLQ